MLYVSVTSSTMYKPIIVGSTPQGQVSISLGDKLTQGNYAFTVGTAAPPSGYRYAVLEALGGYGSYVQVADCGGYYVQVPPLQVSVSANPTSGKAPLSVSFSSSVSGGSPPYSYSWSFGDGSSSTDANPTHTYQNQGTYTATLTVTDSSGSQQSASITIDVSPPVQPLGVTIHVSPATYGDVPFTAAFSSSVTGGTGSYTYKWDFGYGATSNDQNPTQTYTNPGTYSVTLTVTDSAGNTQTASQTITIYPAMSVTISANPTQGNNPLDVSFSSSVTGGSGSYTYSWNFGDGATDTSANPAHTYNSVGSYTVRLSVTDAANAQVLSNQITITVTAPPILPPAIQTAVKIGVAAASGIVIGLGGDLVAAKAFGLSVGTAAGTTAAASYFGIGAVSGVVSYGVDQYTCSLGWNKLDRFAASWGAGTAVGVVLTLLVAPPVGLALLGGILVSTAVSAAVSYATDTGVCPNTSLSTNGAITNWLPLVSDQNEHSRNEVRILARRVMRDLIQ